MYKKASGVPSAEQRGVLAVLAHAGRNRLKVRILYTKITTAQTVERVVEPYSFRYGRCSIGPGRFKWFYGYHGRHRSIEKYLYNNIISAKITTYRFQPRWTIEIS